MCITVRRFFFNLKISSIFFINKTVQFFHEIWNFISVAHHFVIFCNTDISQRAVIDVGF